MTFASYRPELAEFRNRELGFVWQIHSLLAEFTALENVMMPLLIRGQSREQAEPVSMARLEEVGLNATGHRTARGNYRAASSSGWCWPGRWWENPAFLLADEPTGNLDFPDRRNDYGPARRPASLPAAHLDSRHS